MNNTQEEKRASGKQHAVRTWVIFVSFHPLSILVPLHCRGWPPLCFTIESGRLPFGYNQVRRVLHNSRWGVLLAQTRSWRKKGTCKWLKHHKKIFLPRKMTESNDFFPWLSPMATQIIGAVRNEWLTNIYSVSNTHFIIKACKKVLTHF